MGVLDGKVALITGSTSGIGKALAQGFAAAGARVWLHGRNAVAGEALARQLGAYFVAADLAQSEQVERLAETILANEERLDILVNNAGVEIIMPIEQMDMDNLDMIWRVNVRAAFQLTHLLLPLLKQARGSIINITSIHDTMPYPNNSAYSASKAALAMFSKTIAVELAPHGVRVNNFAPGAVETEINREVIREIGEDKFREWIPLGRVAQTDEMIGPALFLASDASSYVTGATLYADGGYLQNLVRYRPE
ncbi:MAG: SDR family oxidoreductase [Chloroflexota bacterium]|nr:SDR family oxidoreductase [Chloroflexota bacterium]